MKQLGAERKREGKKVWKLECMAWVDQNKVCGRVVQVLWRLRLELLREGCGGQVSGPSGSLAVCVAFVCVSVSVHVSVGFCVYLYVSLSVYFCVYMCMVI